MLILPYMHPMIEAKHTDGLKMPYEKYVAMLYSAATLEFELIGRESFSSITKVHSGTLDKHIRTGPGPLAAASLGSVYRNKLVDADNEPHKRWRIYDFPDFDRDAPCNLYISSETQQLNRTSFYSGPEKSLGIFHHWVGNCDTVITYEDGSTDSSQSDEVGLWLPAAGGLFAWGGYTDPEFQATEASPWVKCTPGGEVTAFILHDNAESQFGDSAFGLLHLILGSRQSYFAGDVPIGTGVVDVDFIFRGETYKISCSGGIHESLTGQIEVMSYWED